MSLPIVFLTLFSLALSSNVVDLTNDNFDQVCDFVARCCVVMCFYLIDCAPVVFNNCFWILITSFVLRMGIWTFILVDSDKRGHYP